MRRILAFAAMALACAVLPAVAADAPAKAPAPAAAKKKVVYDSDRLHDLHKEKVGTDCSDCHTAKHTDVLLMKTYAAKGDRPVDRNTCVACHRQPRKPAWYGPVAKK